MLDPIDITGCGEMPKGLKAKNCAHVGRGCRSIRDHVADHCKDHNFPLILGGDHCISIGTISAIKTARPKTGIVWVSPTRGATTSPLMVAHASMHRLLSQVDAHGDINNPARSVSGNMHGMPVAFLMGLVDNAKKLPGFEWFEPTVDVKDVVYIGLRDLDQDEKDTIRRLGIKAYSVGLHIASTPSADLNHRQLALLYCCVSD